MVSVFLAPANRESLTLTYENGLYGSFNWIITFLRPRPAKLIIVVSVDENENGGDHGES